MILFEGVEPDVLGQIRGYPDVEGAVALRGKEKDARVEFARHLTVLWRRNPFVTPA